MRTPDYLGGGLVNLIAELEHRLTGSSASPRLRPAVAAEIPTAASYVLVLIDGLGDHQLGHPAASPLAAARVGALDASFSTQTTVNTATLATGLPPSRHGLIAQLMRLQDPARVVNTIFWFDTEGLPTELDFSRFLPAPNLAERLTAAGAQSLVIEQPSAFVESPLERVLYRGATILGAADEDEAVAIAREESARPGRLVAVYLPHVDTAAHAAGQESELYASALAEVSRVWDALAASLPAGAVAVGTADHGHVDVSADRSLPLPDLDGVVYYGDSRVVYVAGNAEGAASLAGDLPATWVSRSGMEGWWGPPPYHPAFEQRRPDGALVADDGFALRFRGSDGPMVGYHGGLSEPELRVPVLVAGGAPAG